jgi:hypothetical protein
MVEGGFAKHPLGWCFRVERRGCRAGKLGSARQGCVAVRRSPTCAAASKDSLGAGDTLGNIAMNCWTRPLTNTQKALTALTMYASRPVALPA